MLTIFVLPAKKGDAKKLVDSFTLVPTEVRYVVADNVSDINGYDKKTPWFGVFYENEYIEEKLAVALPTFFIVGGFDFLVVFKKLKEEALFSPRFYKSKVYLNDDLSPFFKGWKFEKILNGWVLENEC